jgi:hypothetical protein
MKNSLVCSRIRLEATTAKMKRKLLSKSSGILTPSTPRW